MSPLVQVQARELDTWRPSLPGAVLLGAAIALVAMPTSWWIATWAFASEVSRAEVAWLRFLGISALAGAALGGLWWTMERYAPQRHRRWLRWLLILVAFGLYSNVRVFQAGHWAVWLVSAVASGSLLVAIGLTASTMISRRIGGGAA